MCLWWQREREPLCLCVSERARANVCRCVCVCFKESDNPPSLSLARYLGIRTARKWQTTVKEQVLLGLRCVTEQTLPHQTGCLFCTLPLSSVIYYPNHTESPSCHMVIWMKLIVSTGINGMYIYVYVSECVCVCVSGLETAWLLILYVLFSPPLLPLPSSHPSSSPPPPSFLLRECD